MGEIRRPEHMVVEVVEIIRLWFRIIPEMKQVDESCCWNQSKLPVTILSWNASTSFPKSNKEHLKSALGQVEWCGDNFRCTGTLRNLRTSFWCTHLSLVCSDYLFIRRVISNLCLYTNLWFPVCVCACGCMCVYVCMCVCTCMCKRVSIIVFIEITFS